MWRKGGGATGQGEAGGRGPAPHPRGEAVPRGVTLEDETGGASVNGGHSLGVVTPEVWDLYVAVLRRDGVRANPLCTGGQDDRGVTDLSPWQRGRPPCHRPRIQVTVSPPTNSRPCVVHFSLVHCN